ncbi:MAG: cysteine peptidase family C39 domain-containing protein [Spirochaetales bacterium]|nr:cysteine peptidase family C39 domain-containing protein [Spirochaetales bacterium]
MRFQYINEQQYDTSCGYSTTASLLSLYWNIDVTEEEIVEKYIYKKIENMDYETSLADLSEILNDYAIANKSYKMEYNQLMDINKKYFPIIVHYNKPDDHFALVLGIRGNNIITADPARGVEILSTEQFFYRWSNVVLLSASKEMEINKDLALKAVSVAVSRKENLERWAW